MRTPFTTSRAFAMAFALLLAAPAAAQTKAAPPEKKNEAPAEEKKAEEKTAPADEGKKEAKEPESVALKPPAPAGVGVELALKVGAAVPLAKLGPAPSLALEGAYALPVLERRLRVGLELRLFVPRPGVGGVGATGTLTDPAVQGGTAFNWSLVVQMLAIALPVSYRYDAGAWAVGGGLAPALYLAHSGVTAFELENKETDTLFGGEVFGAFDYKLGPGAVTAEVRYNLVFVDFRATGNAHAGSITAAVGYRYSF